MAKLITAKQTFMALNRSELSEALGESPGTIDRWVRLGCPVLEKGSGKGVESSYLFAEVIRWRLLFELVGKDRIAGLWQSIGRPIGEVISTEPHPLYEKSA